ncbi:MAG: periplasmic heavy metal sensor [Terriglobia bacterium]|nr:periplasmic heavy metal sensor [Terriglobia bacterium]
MRIHSKFALAVVTLGISLPLAFGQSSAPGPAPAPLQSPAAPGGQQFQHPPMHPQRMDQRGPWNPRARERNHGHWNGMHRQFMLARLVSNPSMRERLGITPEQAQKIQSQTFNFQKTEINTGADLAVKRLELRQLLSAETPNRSAIDQKLSEISATRLAQEKAAVDFRLDMRTVLTPDQRQKLEQMRHDFFQHRGFGPRGPGRPGGHGADAHSPDTAG